MLLVFVHGVATRQSTDYLTRGKQRDALFSELVFCCQNRTRSSVIRAQAGGLEDFWGREPLAHGRSAEAFAPGILDVAPAPPDAVRTRIELRQE
jgi:hypothetical protein